MVLKEKQKQPALAPLGSCMHLSEVFVGLAGCIYPMFIYRCVLRHLMYLVCSVHSLHCPFTEEAKAL